MKKISLKEYINISVKQIKSVFTDSEIIENTKLRSTQTYQKLIYTGKQGIYDLQFEQYVWLISGKAYILTLTCEKDQFSSYKEIGEKILNSFRLKKD
mgnify:CR=1 FL=1